MILASKAKEPNKPKILSKNYKSSKNNNENKEKSVNNN
jgi:hypothetical protein